MENGTNFFRFAQMVTYDWCITHAYIYVKEMGKIIAEEIEYHNLHIQNCRENENQVYSLVIVYLENIGNE